VYKNVAFKGRKREKRDVPRKRRRKKRGKGGLNHQRGNDVVEAEVVAETEKRGGVEADLGVAKEPGGGGPEVEARIAVPGVDIQNHAGNQDPGPDPERGAGDHGLGPSDHSQGPEGQGPEIVRKGRETEVGIEEVETDQARTDLVKIEVVEPEKNLQIEAETSLLHVTDPVRDLKKETLTQKVQ